MYGHMYRSITSEILSSTDSERQNERGGKREKKENMIAPSLHH